MKLAVALLLAALSPSGIGAFSPSPLSRPATSANTALHQFGNLGFDTNNLYTREEEDAMRTQVEVMSYLAPLLAPTAVRSDLGNNVMVSGFDPRDPSATEVLSFLNAEESPHFPFTKIVAHVPDVKLAKKRLIGREARYTGLLDKLAFSDGEDATLPTSARLEEEGISSWVAHVAGGDLGAVSDVAAAAKGAKCVKNVAVLVSGARAGTDGAALREAEETLKEAASSADDGFRYTLLVVPEWNDEPEATTAYGLVNATDVVVVGDDAHFAEGETFSREESLRLVTECLAIEKAAGACVAARAAKDAGSLEHLLVQGMREIGYTRLGEVEHMVASGVKGYNDMIEERSKTTAWEKAPEPTAEEKALLAKTKAEQDALFLEKRAEANRKAEMEAMALQWAKREYLRKNLKRRIPIKEKDFVEIVWDRALFEAELKYRTMQGQAVNESEERRQFRERQEKKKRDAYEAEQKRWKAMAPEELEPPEERTVSFR